MNLRFDCQDHKPSLTRVCQRILHLSCSDDGPAPQIACQRGFKFCKRLNSNGGVISGAIFALA